MSSTMPPDLASERLHELKDPLSNDKSNPPHLSISGLPVVNIVSYCDIIFLWLSIDTQHDLAIASAYISFTLK